MQHAVPTANFATTTQTYLNMLAKRITQIDPLASQRLTLLSDALTKPASSWNHGDLHELIDIDTITERARGQVHNRFLAFMMKLLEWLRNGLILFPLALTWLSISQAVSHYKTLLQKNPQDAQQPFILLWEQGFNGHLWSEFTLSRVAFWDFILLTIILGLTLIVTWQQGFIESHKEQQAASLRSELSDGLARAALCLHEKQLSNPTDFAGVVMRLDHVIQQVATKFDNVTQQMDGMIQQFLTELQAERQQRGTLNSFLQGLDKVSQRMLDGADSIKSATTILTTSLDALVIPVQEIPVQQKDLIQQTHTILGQLVPLTNDMHQLITDQQTQWQSLQHAIVTSSQQLLAEQGQAHQQMLTEQQGFDHALHDLLTNNMGQLITQQNQNGREIADAIDAINVTQNQMPQLMQQIQQVTDQQQQIIQTIENEHRTQISMTQHMHDTANEMKNALTAIQAITPEMRSIAIDMNRLTTSLRSIPADLKTELFDPLQRYSNAADTIARNAAHMANAAAVMQQAGQELLNAATALQGQHVP